MTVAGQRPRQLARLRPRLAFIVREYDERVLLAAVLAQQYRDLLAIRRADQPRLANVRGRVLGDHDRPAPTQPAVLRNRLVDPHGVRFRAFARIADEPAVVVKQGHVVAVLEPLHAPHHHDAAPVADRLQRRPALAVIFRNRQTNRIQTREHNQSLHALPIDDAVNRGHFR